jgi:hypothetical protein
MITQVAAMYFKSCQPLLFVVKILDNELIGRVGETRSDTLRTIIMSWLSDQGYLSKGGKHQEKQD